MSSHKKGGAGDDEKESDVEIDVLVLDHGTGFIKAGFAGQDAPRLVIPTLVASQSVASSAFSSSSSSSADASSSASASASAQEWIGADALHAYRAAHAPDANADDAVSFALTCPIERGQITDWDAMQRIWDFIFRQLRVDPARHAVLIALPPPIHQKSAQATRERLAEIFFQQYRVRALCIANACVLSLFASGRTTGLVLELGEGATFAVPVFEGFALPHATASIPLAGADLSAHLISLLNAAQTHHARTAEGRAFLAAQQLEHAFEFDLTAHQDVVRDLKARRVRVLPEADAPLPRNTHPSASAAASGASGASDSIFELPDGQYVHVDLHSRYRAAEILFSPSDANSTVSQGVHELAYDSIVKCDNFLQRDLFQNIVLAGGTSMLEGFAERLQNEIQLLDRGAHAVCVVQDSQRRHAAWIGGSMLASLPTFGPLKVTRAEYEESPDAVHKKFF